MYEDEFISQNEYDIIAMSNHELEELIKLYVLNLINRQTYPRFINDKSVVVISCNGNDTWFCCHSGRHAIEEREYIDLESFPALKQIVKKFLRLSPRGGRLKLMVGYTDDSPPNFFVHIPGIKETLCYLEIS
ncbi:MAG: hypothetical protein K9W42_13330 [Candidatus Heimdallarchaeota archaeon]|nr:hypothetical protein [Candidatus Heimdallarchaeota archaeon]